VTGPVKTGHFGMGNWKQWKRKPEMENGIGKLKQSNVDAHVY